MPIFEYKCQACRYSFDALQKAGAGALRKCPECGKLKLTKLTSAPTFHLKGTGWHKPTASSRRRVVERKGHVLDAGPAHSHDHDSSHSHGGHTHSHGGKSHSHGPGHKHDHKH
jgi:putative FmdB family regulatory protein